MCVCICSKLNFIDILEKIYIIYNIKCFYHLVSITIAIKAASTYNC